MRADAGEIRRMIHDLAADEREPDAVRTTAERLTEHPFGDHPAVFVTAVEAEPGWSGAC